MVLHLLGIREEPVSVASVLDTRRRLVEHEASHIVVIGHDLHKSAETNNTLCVHATLVLEEGT